MASIKTNDKIEQ